MVDGDDTGLVDCVRGKRMEIEKGRWKKKKEID
jgi:hypothetical protein